MSAPKLGGTTSWPFHPPGVPFEDWEAVFQPYVRVDRVRSAGAGHTFQRGMAALARTPGVDRHLLEQLGSLPVDGRVGKRLEALAALMGLLTLEWAVRRLKGLA